MKTIATSPSFIFLYMAAQGGGNWSLDALLRRKKSNATSAPIKVA